MNVSYLKSLPTDVLVLIFLDIDVDTFKKYRETSKSPLLLKNSNFWRVKN